jgi:hypothetical protein
MQKKRIFMVKLFFNGTWWNRDFRGLSAKWSKSQSGQTGQMSKWSNVKVVKF